MITIKTADGGEVIVSGSDFTIRHNPPRTTCGKVRTRQRAQHRINRFRPTPPSSSSSSGNNSNSSSEDEQDDGEDAVLKAVPGTVVQVLLEHEPAAWLLVIEKTEEGCAGLWFYNHDDPNNPVADARTVVLLLGKPEYVHHDSIDGPPLSIQAWHDALRANNIEVYPYPCDGHGQFFFRVPVSTWIFGWCEATPLGTASSSETLQERLRDMTRGNLLQHFESVAKALSTCGTCDAGRSRDIRAHLASHAWSIRRRPNPLAAPENGTCWACRRERRLTHCLVRTSSADSDVRLLGSQCAAQLDRLAQLYARLTKYLSSPLPTTAAALDAVRSSLADL